MLNCPSCSTILPDDAFAFDRSNKRTGRQSRCRQCAAKARISSRDAKNAQGRDYYRANKDKILPRTRSAAKLRRSADPEESRKRCQLYHAANREKIAERKKLHRGATKDIQRERGKAYHSANQEARNAKSRTWYLLNREKVAIRHKAWAQTNSHLTAERARRRVAAKIRATPLWADFVAIRAIYAEAAKLTKETGIEHEVDHIVPLQSRVVCGLHCEANLKIMTAEENRQKSNTWDCKLLAQLQIR